MRLNTTIRSFLTIFLVLAGLVPVVAQASVSEEVTAFYSFGLAGEDQVLPDDIDGAYSEQKNGYFVDGKVTVRSGIDFRYDLFLQMSARARAGSPYLGLQLGPASPQPSLNIALDSAYVRLNILGGLELISPPVELYLKAGRYATSAANLRTGRWGLENATSMVRTANLSSLSLEVTKRFETLDQFWQGRSSFLTVELASAGLFEEAIQRLYDTDGGLSQHGKAVVGEYAPQLFVAARLNNYVLPFGILSLDAAYSMNGAGIYSGHAAGLSAKLLTILKQNEMYVPLTLSGAFYEKNLDILAGAAGNGLNNDTTAFRNTIKVGAAVGFQYMTPISLDPADALRTRIEADVTLGGALTVANHLYRDPFTLLSLGLDGRVTINRGFFAGAGVYLGTLGDVTWETAEGVLASDDDYSHTFSLIENLGAELYTGINISGTARLSLGAALNRGLAMGKGIEAIPDGMVKYRQPGSALSEDLWETFAVYLLFNGRL